MKYKNFIFDLHGTLIKIKIDEKDLKNWRRVKTIFGYYGFKSATAEEMRDIYLQECKKEYDTVSLIQKNPEINLRNVFANIFNLI